MKNVEDIYPVSPMQEAMLLHALTHRDRDTLLSQFVFRINAEVDADAFRAAWEAVLRRHAILRTAFVIDKVKTPLQVVRKTVELPVAIADWRGGDTAAQLESWLHADRKSGIEPARAPLMRLLLARTGPAQWYFVWTSHHLLMDRWCLGPVLADAGTAYEMAIAGRTPALPAAPSFRLFINYLAGRDREDARNYWRGYLAGFSRPTPIDPTASSSVATVRAQSLTVAGDQWRGLRQLAASAGVTTGTLLQGAWALCVHRCSGAVDVVFGTAVAGRPAAIAEVENIVGSFVNNLPVRVRIDETQLLGPWLKTLQSDALARGPHEYLSPPDTHACSELPADAALFDNLVVALAADSVLPGLPLEPIRYEFATAYPVTVSLAEQPDSLTVHLHRRALEDNPPLLAHFDQLLQAMAACNADSPLGELPGVQGRAELPQPGAATVKIAAPQASDLDAMLQQGREAIELDHMSSFVAGEMAAVLGVADVQPDQDFFLAGGDSLRAARLHERIVTGTRKTVPLLALFHTSTARGMARTLVEQAWPMTPGIAIGLKTRGPRPPVFCIASPEVNTLGYYVLARHLADDERVYVLQAPPANERMLQMDPAATPKLATEYLAALREIAPTGPYRLLGMCSGAHIAVEMARQLEAAGTEIDYLGIINTWGFYTVSSRYYWHRLKGVLRYYRGRVQQLLGAPATSAAVLDEPVRERAPSLDAQTAGAGLDNPWIRDFGFERRDPGKPKLNVTAHVYRLENQQYWRIRDRALGWGKQIRNVQVSMLPGDNHNEILREPQVRPVAQLIAAQLKKKGSTP